MRTEITESGMLCVYDEEGNERVRMQLSAPGYKPDPVINKPSEQSSIIPYIPLIGLFGGLL